jgi:hypothetical protein
LIAVNRQQSALECTICGDLEGVSRNALENPELLTKLKQRVAQQHANCEQYKDNPKRAQAERQYSKRMQAELRVAHAGGRYGA